MIQPTNHAGICSRLGLMQNAGLSSGQQGASSEFTDGIKQNLSCDAEFFPVEGTFILGSQGCRWPDHKAPKKLWRNLSTIFGKDKSSSNKSCSITPDQFAEFFIDKVKLVQKQTATATPPSIPVTCTEHLDCFQSVTEKNIEYLIMAAPNKCCALDPAPIWLVKRCSGCIAPFITMMCKRSILGGNLPISQKTAIVTPGARVVKIELPERTLLCELFMAWGGVPGRGCALPVVRIFFLNFSV